MDIEELNLDVRLYNAVKRAGIHTVADLIEKLYQHDAITKIGARNIINIEKALKKAGIRRYARGDYITEDDILPEPLTWEQLHGMVGQLVALDISTESQTTYRVVWLYSFNDDDTRLIFQQDGNGYGNTADHGEFYALKQEEPEMIVTEQRTPPADESLAVTEQYTEAYNLNVKIHTSMQAIQQNLYDMCSALKQMRDGKLYKELGYQNFEEYCENGAGIGRQHAYKYISIIEKLPPDFVASMRQIGMTKLTLLTALTDDQREQLTENVDLESTTVRELKAQISALQSQNADSEKARIDAETRAQKWYDKTQEMQEQIDELESRPVEVAVPEPSHEVQNMQDAMRRLNREHEEWSAKIQDEHFKHVQEIHAKHREETEALRAEYEQKLAAAQLPADTSEVFHAYLGNMVDAVRHLVGFLKAHPDSGQTEMAIKTLKNAMEELK